MPRGPKSKKLKGEKDESIKQQIRGYCICGKTRKFGQQCISRHPDVSPITLPWPDLRVLFR